jgi:large subunit ribosomal protein L29
VAERKPRATRRPARRGRQKETDANKDPQARLRELHEEMFRLRFQFATRQLTNTARIRIVRREIARVRTLQRQQELQTNA